MPRPRSEPAFASAIAPALLRLVRAREVDASLLALRAGMSPDVEREEECSITASTLAMLVEGASDMLGEPHLALRMPTELPLRRYGLAELAARASSTVRDALAHVAKYATLVHPLFECALEGTSWKQRTPSHPRGLGRHLHEYGLAFALVQARSGAPVTPTRVWFSHARPRDLGALERFFGTSDLDFGCDECGFELSEDALSTPMQGSDPRLLATAIDLADAALRAQPTTKRFSDLVATRLESLLPDHATMEETAEALKMSPRTLQRRLEEDATKFSDVLERVRETLARRWLREPNRSLTEIAFGLGFSDLATFSRAFKRWTGVPPGTWRARSTISR